MGIKNRVNDMLIRVAKDDQDLTTFAAKNQQHLRQRRQDLEQLQRLLTPEIETLLEKLGMDIR